MPFAGNELSLPGRDVTEEGTGVWVGAGDGDGEPKSRRVEEKRRDGSRRVEEN